MTSDFYDQLARKIALEKSRGETWSSAYYSHAYGFMTKFFEVAYSKLSPTQRMQVAEEITKITES